VDGVKERLTCSSMAATTPPTAVAAAPAVAAAAAPAAAGAAESEECRRSSFDEGPPFAVLARATSFTYSLSTGSKFGDSTALDDGALAPIAHVVDGVRRSRYEEDEEENDFENVKEATSTSAPAGSSRDALAEALEGSSASSREAIAAALARYIPRSAHATDPRSVNMRWLGEIRQCSVLFMNFTAAAADKDESESESESESVVTFANKALRVAQDVLHKHSGCVRQCIVDDKGGITLVACFGLPASTHEDDPWRAVATAMTTKSGAFHALVPIRPRRRGERRSLRTFATISLRLALAFKPRPRRLSTPADAFQLHPDGASHGTALRNRRERRPNAHRRRDRRGVLRVRRDQTAVRVRAVRRCREHRGEVHVEHGERRHLSVRDDEGAVRDARGVRPGETADVERERGRLDPGVRAAADAHAAVEPASELDDRVRRRRWLWWRS